MIDRIRQWAGVLVFATAAMGAAPALAGPYSSLYVFGDSLSDTGNVYAATGGTVPVAPYFAGRFSDGPVWIDHLATGLGVPAGATPSLLGGNNYAFGGARTAGTTPVPGLLAQFGGLWAPAHPGGADPDALYVVAGGGNDMRDARSAFTGDTAADQAGRQTAAATAAGNLLNVVMGLASAGARHILVANLPDLGATPEAAFLGLTAPSTDASARYNALVAGIEAVAEGLVAGLDVLSFDLAGVAAAIRDDALNHGGATFGITNVVAPCGPFPGSLGASCAVSAFSDALHPTAAAHAIIGAAALRAAGVPEPATLWLAALAIGGLLLHRRRA